MKETILKRYKVRQDILKVSNQLADLKRIEDILDNIITYKALQLDDPAEAKRFKKNNIDNKKEGLFMLKVKNGLKVDIPVIEE